MSQPSVSMLPSESPSPTPTPTPLVVKWVATPPPAIPLTPSQLGIRHCLATDLAGSYLATGAAAGNVLNTIAIRDISRTRCYIKGKPHVRLITADGRAFPWSRPGSTYFPDDGSIEILLTPDTRFPNPGEEIATGLAELGFSYFDCDAKVKIARIIVQFSGRSFSTNLPPNSVGSTGLPACNGVTVQTGPVETTANNFQPPTFAPSPYRDLRLTVDTPSAFRAGTKARFLVTFTNEGSTPVLGSNCPGYRETLKGPGVDESFSYRLNCDSFELGFTDSITFEMFIDVPTHAHGTMTLWWGLLPDHVDSPFEQLPVVVRA